MRWLKQMWYISVTLVLVWFGYLHYQQSQFNAEAQALIFAALQAVSYLLGGGTSGKM